MPKRRNWRSDWAICRRLLSSPNRTPRQEESRTRPKPARPKASRNIGGLPNHLPREDVVIEPESDICPCCQGKLHRIGEDVSEMLDIVPAIIRVKRIRRPKYGCRACESRGGAGARAAASHRRRPAHGRAAGAYRGVEIRVAFAVAPPDPDAGGSWHSSRSFNVGALDRTGRLVAEAVARRFCSRP